LLLVLRRVVWYMVHEKLVQPGGPYTHLTLLAKSRV